MVPNIDINLGRKITTKKTDGDTQPSVQIWAMYDPLGMRFFNAVDIYGVAPQTRIGAMILPVARGT